HGGHGPPRGALGDVQRVPGNCGLSAGGGGDEMTDSSSRHGGHQVEPTRRGFGFGRGHRVRAVGMPVERPQDFAGTLRRLLAYIKPRAWQLSAVFVLAALGTVFNILAPKIMGDATTLLFDGFMLKRQGAAGSVVDFPAIARI